MSFKGRELLFEPVRNPVDWDQVVRIALTVSLATYRSIIARYCPEEETEFKRIYGSEWRSRFNSIGSVKAVNGTYEFTFSTKGDVPAAAVLRTVAA